MPESTPSPSRPDDRPGEGARLPRWLGRTLIALGVLALLLVASGLAARAYFTPEKLASLVVPRVERAAGRDVQVSAVRLKLLPRPAVRLEDVALAAAPGLGPEPALSGEAVDLQLAVLPLLTGDLSVTRLRLVAPTVRYRVAADGSHSFSDLGGERTGRPAASGGGEGEADGRALSVSEVEVERATVVYDDRRSGRGARFRAAGTFDASGRADAPGGLVSRGELRIDSLRTAASRDAVDSIEVASLRLTYEAALSGREDSLALRSLGLEAEGLRASGSGSVAWGGETPRVDLRLETGEADVGDLLRLARGASSSGPDADGRVRLTVRVAGAVGAGATPTMEATARLRDVALAFPGREALASDVGGELSFTSGSLAVGPLEGRLLGRELRLEGTVADLDSLRADLRAEGAADLGRLEGALPEGEGAGPMAGLDPGGDLSFSVRVRGALRGERWPRMTGEVRLPALEGTVDGRPLRSEPAVVRLTGSGLATDGWTLRSGDTDLTLSAEARNVLPPSRLRATEGAAGPRPSVDFRLSSDLLAVDQLLPAPAQADTAFSYARVLKAHLSGGQVAGRPPGDVASERYPLPALPRLDAAGEVRVGEVVHPAGPAQDLALEVHLDEGRLRVEQLRAGLYGGTLAGALSAEPDREGRRWPVRYDLQLRGADAGTVTERWTKLGKALTGTLDASVAGRTALGGTFLPVTGETEADGRVTVRDGSLERMVPMQGVMRAIGVSSSRIARFDSLGGPYRVRDGRLELDGWRLHGRGAVGGSVAGTVDLTGPLDLDMTLSVPLALLEGSPLLKAAGGEEGRLGRLLGRAAGADSVIDVPLSLGGTMGSPAVTVQEEVFADRLERLLERKGTDLLRGLFERRKEEKKEGGGGGGG